MDEASTISPPRSGARAAALAAALTAAALLSAACGGGSPASAAGTNGTRLQQAVAFARCMRSHGAPHYPGPNSSGVFIMTSHNAADFQHLNGAGQACSYLARHLPRGGKPELGPVMQARQNRKNLAFARCMHRHGIRKFPENWGGGINIGRMQRLGIDTNSPQFSAALNACGF